MSAQATHLISYTEYSPSTIISRQEFEATYIKYRKGILNLFLVKHIPLSISEELAATVWTKAWEKLSSFQGKSKLGSWVYKIALNERANYFKRIFDKELSIYLDVPVVHDFNIDFYSDLRSDKPSLEAIANRLPDIYKYILLFACKTELSWKEAAKAHGLAPANYKTRLHRAILLAKKHVAKI